MKTTIFLVVLAILSASPRSLADGSEILANGIRQVYHPTPLQNGKTPETEYVFEFLSRENLDQKNIAKWLKDIALSRQEAPPRISDSWNTKPNAADPKPFYVERYIKSFGNRNTRRVESVQLSTGYYSTIRDSILQNGIRDFNIIEIHSNDKRYGPDWTILNRDERCIYYGNQERNFAHVDNSDCMVRWPEAIDLSLFLITADINWIQKLQNKFPSANSREFYHYPVSEKRLRDFVSMFEYQEATAGDLIYQLKQGKYFNGVAWEIILEGTPPYRKKFVQLNDTDRDEVTACAAYVWPAKPGEREILYQFYPHNGNKANALTRMEFVSTKVHEPDEELHQKLFTFTPPKDWVVVDHTQTPTVETRNGEVIDVWTEEKPDDQFEWSFDYIFSSRSKLLLYLNLIAIPFIFYFTFKKQAAERAESTDKGPDSES